MKKTIVKFNLESLMTLVLALISIPFLMVYWLVDENHKANKKKWKFS